MLDVKIRDAIFRRAAEVERVWDGEAPHARVVVLAGVVAELLCVLHEHAVLSDDEIERVVGSGIDFS